MNLATLLNETREFFARTAAGLRALPDDELVALLVRGPFGIPAAAPPTAALRDEIASRTVIKIDGELVRPDEAATRLQAKPELSVKVVETREVATSTPRPSYKGRVPSPRLDLPPSGRAQNAILDALRERPRKAHELQELLQIDAKTMSAILSRLKSRGSVLKPANKGDVWRLPK